MTRTLAIWWSLKSHFPGYFVPEARRISRVTTLDQAQRVAVLKSISEHSGSSTQSVHAKWNYLKQSVGLVWTTTLESAVLHVTAPYPKRTIIISYLSYSFCCPADTKN